MPAAQLLHVAYALLTEGGTNEAIDEFDAALEATESVEPEQKLADIIALGGAVR